MNRDLLNIFRSRLTDMGGWCETAGSVEDVIRIVNEKYPYSRDHVVLSQRLVHAYRQFDTIGLNFQHLDRQKRRQILASAKLGITLCDGLIAETGTAVLVNHQSEPRVISLLPERHLVIGSMQQLYSTLDTWLGESHRRFGRDQLPSITLISGPSRTSDIEKELVVGVHGPVEFGVIVLM